MLIKKSAKNMIQTRFDDTVDLSVASDKDAVKAAKRAERDERKAKVMAEAAAARVHGALHGDKPVLVRNTCVLTTAKRAHLCCAYCVHTRLYCNKHVVLKSTKVCPMRAGSAFCKCLVIDGGDRELIRAW